MLKIKDFIELYSSFILLLNSQVHRALPVRLSGFYGSRNQVAGVALGAMLRVNVDGEEGGDVRLGLVVVQLAETNHLLGEDSHILFIFASHLIKVHYMLTPQDKKVLEEIHNFLLGLGSPIGLQPPRLQFVRGNANKYYAELEKILAKI